MDYFVAYGACVGMEGPYKKRPSKREGRFVVAFVARA